MSNLLVADQLKTLSATEFLEMDTSDVKELGFKPAPAGVYTGTVNVEAEEVDAFEEGGEPQVKLSFVISGLTAIELQEGSEGEAAEELDNEKDCPEKIIFSYLVPSRGQNLKTDWEAIALEVSGADSLTFGGLIEACEGITIQFTNSYYRTVSKREANKGEPVLYTNIKNIALIDA